MVDFQMENLKKLVIDGEDFYIADPAIVEEVLAGALIDGSPIFSVSLARASWDTVKRSNDLELGFHRGLFSRNKWWSCVLFNSGQGDFHRINLQNEICSNCSWRGTIGNPLQFEIYNGAKDRDQAFERAKSLQPIKCPNCSEPFQVFAVWAGE